MLKQGNDPDKALVSPRVFLPLYRRTARRVVMTFDTSHTDRMRKILELPEKGKRMGTAVYYAPAIPAGAGLAGPALGCPLAAVVAEILFACGTKTIIPFGTCGSLQRFAKIGQYVVADSAFSDEGTSRHYFPKRRVFQTDRQGCDELMRFLQEHDEIPHSGRVWTTDAFFRETREKVAGFRDQGLLAADMELSALCAIAEYRGGKSIVPLLVISDSLATLKWKPGMILPGFRERIQRAMELLADFLMDRKSKT